MPAVGNEGTAVGNQILEMLIFCHGNAILLTSIAKQGKERREGSLLKRRFGEAGVAR